VDAVVLRCLAKRKEARFGSAAELAGALREALLGQAGQGGTWRRGVAVHAAADADLAAGGRDDEALLAAADAVLAAEEALREAGLLVPLATGDAVLGVALLGDDPAAERARRAEVVGLARALAAAGGRVALAVTVHAGAVRVRDAAGGPEVAGGPLCETGRWAASAPGLHVTEAAAAGLDDAAAPGAGRAQGLG
jgi:hypothetical protein